MPETTPADCCPTASRACRAVWLACYVLLGGVLIYALTARYFLPLQFSQPVGIERASADVADPADDAAAAGLFDERIDPNTAGWSELTRLPGIGEVTAKRIVAYREEHRTDPDQPVFRSAADLDQVRGIGPKTVEAIEPLLRFEAR